MGTKTLLTLEQFDQLPVQEGKLLELDEGELSVMSTGLPRHNRVRNRLAFRLMVVVEEGGWEKSSSNWGSVFLRIPYAFQT